MPEMRILLWLLNRLLNTQYESSAHSCVGVVHRRWCQARRAALRSLPRLGLAELHMVPDLVYLIRQDNLVNLDYPAS